MNHEMRQKYLLAANDFWPVSADEDVDETDMCHVFGICGNLQDMKWAREHGGKWGWMLGYDVALQGHLDCLRYMHEQGYALASSTMRGAAVGGHLPILRYLCDMNCPGHEEILENAVQHNRRHVIKFVMDNPSIKCNLQQVGWEAASHGHIDLLEYFKEHLHYVYNESTMEGATLGCKLDTMKYLYAQKCPWDKRVVNTAIAMGHVDCLRFALQHQCPYDKEEAIKEAKEHEDEACVELMLKELL